MKTRTLTLVLLAALTGCATTRSDHGKLNRTSQALSDCKEDLQNNKATLAVLRTEREATLEAEGRRTAAYRDIERRLLEAFDTGTLKIFIRNGKLVVRLPNRILFDLGQSRLKPEGAAALGRIAGVLKTLNGREFLVAGHTDNVPVSRKSTLYKSNWELSQMRALTVLLALERQGVRPKQIAATGYGEHQPEAANDTKEGRARNRRTELIVMPLLDELPRMPREEILLAADDRQ